MKCNKGTDLVCTNWEKCNKAWKCDNVPKAIRNKLKGKYKASVLVKSGVTVKQ